MGPCRFIMGLVALIALVGLAGCARNISQEKATAADGKIKGAKPLQFENGEARSSGIVTYPGGDRIDWKVVELPEKKKGDLDLKLTWTPPRPGLQLAFDVFDEWNTLVLSSKKSSKKSKSRVRTETLKNAKGKYFIRVYAVNRGDAGKYKLTLEFKEAVAGVMFDPLKLEIADPPKLAAVPDIEQGCDEFTFDPKVPACKLVCPAVGAPPGWPACKGKCPSPPTVDEPACWATMPCPKGAPDERIKACKPKDWPPCPDKKNPDESNPNCRVKAAPVVGRIIGKEVQGGDLIIRIGIGSDQGVSKGWVGTVIKGPDLTDRAVPGGDVSIVRIDKAVTVARIKLTADQIAATPYVRLEPK
ncbi:MAG TPA: hypothetical protein VFQ53_26075 [Kofleriaceae bacterium]|nr:hypothetical protein [Kofleriaceae bacterium]